MGAVYFLIAIGACTVGALTGMGGGVFIKPILDSIGQFDVASINMLSSTTVLCMSVVSVVRQRHNPAKPTVKVAVSLAVGAVAGGLVGSTVLDLLIGGERGRVVTLIQNAVLIVLILGVLLYMKQKDKLKSLSWQSLGAGAAVGLALGFFSSFLGIGGGPINVALIVFCFGYSTKQAALCSLVTIMFSQGAKVLPELFTGRMVEYDLRVLPYMIAGAIAGGLLGAVLNKKLTEKQTERLFGHAQILILLICGVNIIKNL